MFLRAGFCTAVVVTGVFIAAGSAGAYAPVTPVTLHTQNRVDSPQIETGGDGTVVAAWSNGTNNGETGHVSMRPAGGWFSAPHVVNYGYSSSLDLYGGGPVGTQAVLLQQRPGTATPWLVAGSGLVLRELWSGSPGYTSTLTRCPNGDLFVLGRTTGTPTNLSGYIADSGLAQSGSASYSYGSSTNFGGVSASCDSRSLPLVGRVDKVPSPNTLTVRPALGGTTIVSRTAPTTGTSLGTPKMFVQPDGRVWVLWSEYTSTSWKTFAVTRAPGDTGAGGAPVQIGDAKTAMADAEMDGVGRVHVVLSRQEVLGEGQPVSYSLATAQPGSGTLGAAATLLPPGHVGAGLLTGAPDGALRLLLSDQSSGTVRMSGLPAFGSSDPDTLLTGPGFEPTDYAWTSAGDLFAIAAFERATDVVDVKVGGLDSGVPPTLDALSVPGVAAAGGQIALSVKATDSFGVAGVNWSIDGAGVGSGESVNATVTTPGTKTVTVTATDFAGLQTSASRTVNVVDPNPVTPPVVPVPVDKVAPKLTSSATRAKKGKRARQVRVTVRTDEASSVVAELIGKVRRGGRTGTIILTSKTVKSLAANKSKTLTLKIPAALAKLAYKGKLNVRVVATDKAGNRRTKTLKIKRTSK